MVSGGVEFKIFHLGKKGIAKKNVLFPPNVTFQKYKVTCPL
jgi:hypothetical protein